MLGRWAVYQPPWPPNQKDNFGLIDKPAKHQHLALLLTSFLLRCKCGCTLSFYRRLRELQSQVFFPKRN